MVSYSSIDDTTVASTSPKSDVFDGGLKFIKSPLVAVRISI